MVPSGQSPKGSKGNATGGPNPGTQIAADPATVDRRGAFRREGNIPGASPLEPGDPEPGRGNSTAASGTEAMMRESGARRPAIRCGQCCPGLKGTEIPLANTEVVMAAHTVSTALPITGSQRLLAASAALALGVFLVWGVGLANSSALHDTAHDTRHSYGFPCH